MAGIIGSLPQRPDAILIISAHWETETATVSTAALPDMIYDYNGFPPHTYTIRHDAPGDPVLARGVAQRLRGAGISVAEDPQRGFDHGVFVPMMVIDPSATIPIVTMSLQRDLDPAAHLAIGHALAPLRAENILIVGSGNSFHNLSTFANGKDGGSAAFDTWLTAAMIAPDTREKMLIDWLEAPGARLVHPDAEHLLPLIVVAGSASGATAQVDFHDAPFGKTISGYSLF